MKTKTKAWINLGVYLVTIAINAMGATGLINRLSQKQVSDRYDTFITPSPAAFSIWGVIYTLLLVSLVYLIIRHREPGAAKATETISLPFWLSSAANILWIVTFSFEWIGVSTLMIFAFVIILALLNLKLKWISGKERSLLALTFGLYNGWLLIASVVNTAAYLVQVKWAAFGLAPDTWAVIILSASILITAGIQIRLRNAMLTLPIAWAYFGIWQRHGAQGAFAGQYPAVLAASLIGSALLILIAAAVFWLNGRSLLPAQEGNVKGN